MNPLSKQEPQANSDRRRPTSSSAAAQILMQCRWPLALLELAVILAIVGLIAWNQSQSAMRDAIGQAAQAVSAVGTCIENENSQIGGERTVDTLHFRSMPRISLKNP